MIEFYTIFEKILSENNMNAEIEKLKLHIYEKRKPLDEIKQLLTQNNFSINKINHHHFALKFIDGSSMLNHYFMRLDFLDSWKRIIPSDKQLLIFNKQI